MKNFLSLMLILGCFQFTQANNIENLDILAKTKVVKVDVINLSLSNLNGNHTRIDLTNLDGKTSYYSEWMEEKQDYNRNINVADLADGKYLLSVKSGNELIRQVIKIKKGVIRVSQFK